MVHPADLHSLFGRDDIEVSRFDVPGNHQLDAAAGEACAFAAKPADTNRKLLGGVHRLQFHKAPVCTAFLFNIAECGNVAVLENEDFVAGLVNVSQQM